MMGRVGEIWRETKEKDAEIMLFQDLITIIK